MSQNQLTNPRPAPTRSAKAEAIPYGWLMVTFFTFIVGAIGLYVASPMGVSLRTTLAQLFAFDSENVVWYIVRSSGFIAYLLLWLSTAWGLAIPSKIADRFLHGSYTFEFHQFISLLSLGFLGLHMLVLLVDLYLPYNVFQILVPFLSPYRPLWVGVGVIAFYLTALVTVTYYLRARIGMKAFRYIHYTSLIGYVGATAHSFFSGTDSALPMAQFMYAGTFLVVVFLTVYWLFLVWMGKQPTKQSAPKTTTMTGISPRA
jgi:predicted ferric reductase